MYCLDNVKDFVEDNKIKLVADLGLNLNDVLVIGKEYYNQCDVVFDDINIFEFEKRVDEFLSDDFLLFEVLNLLDKVYYGKIESGMLDKFVILFNPHDEEYKLFIYEEDKELYAPNYGGCIASGKSVDDVIHKAYYWNIMDNQIIYIE